MKTRSRPRRFATCALSARPASNSPWPRASAKGDLQRAARAAYVDGPKVSVLASARAVAEAANGINAGQVAAAMLRLDCPAPEQACFIVPPTASGRRQGARRLALGPERVLVV